MNIEDKYLSEGKFGNLDDSIRDLFDMLENDVKDCKSDYEKGNLQRTKQGLKELKETIKELEDEIKAGIKSRNSKSWYGNTPQDKNIQDDRVDKF